MTEPRDTTNNHDRCENCGAPLPPPDDGGLQTCTFCKSVVQATPNDRDQPDISPTIQIAITSDSLESKRSSGGCIGRVIGLVIILAIVVGAVIIPLTVAFDSTGFLDDALKKAGITGKASDVDAGTVLSLGSNSGEPSAPIELVAVVRTGTTDGGQSRNRIERFSTSSDNSIWDSKEFTGDSSTVPMVTDGNSVFVASGTDLHAFDLNDAHERWTRALSDKVISTCSDCLWIVENQVITKTADGMLAAFDSANGNPTWNRRLEDTSARVFIAQGSVGLIDRVNSGKIVLSLNPATGEVIDQFAPVCQLDNSSIKNGISNDALILTAPGDVGVYIGFGGGPACWQRWDPTTHTVTWNVTIENGYLDSGAHGFIAGGTLWFTTRDRALLGGINLASGHFTQLPTLPETDSIPIALHGNTLILRGQSTRGTSRFLLWGLDVPSGNQRWQFLLDTAKPADPPDAETIFTSQGDKRFSANLNGDTLYVAVFDEASRSIIINNINPDTGSLAPPVILSDTTQALLPDFLPIEWSGSSLVLHLGNSLAVVDCYNGSITRRWGSG